MNLNDLTLFATTARLGSITKAAKSLATVQSNVTGRIRLLEEELGAPLFHRHHHGVSLTPKGREFLSYAQQVTALLQKARETVSGREPVGGTLRIGSIQSTASARLPAVLKRYVTRHDHVDIVVDTGTPIELVGRVLDHTLDGAFVPGPVEHEELESVPAFVEELVLVTPATFATVDALLARSRVAKILVLRVGCTYRLRLERYLAQRGVGFVQAMEFGTLDGILGCVGAGLGMAMLPRSVVERSVRRHHVRAHALPEDVRQVETIFALRRTGVRSSALECFVGLLERP